MLVPKAVLPQLQPMMLARRVSCGLCGPWEALVQAGPLRGLSTPAASCLAGCPVPGPLHPRCLHSWGLCHPGQRGVSTQPATLHCWPPGPGRMATLSLHRPVTHTSPQIPGNALPYPTMLSSALTRCSLQSPWQPQGRGAGRGPGGSHGHACTGMHTHPTHLVAPA